MKLVINRINQVNYDVIETGDNAHVHLRNRLSDKNVLGSCDVTYRRIYIHKDLVLSRKIQVLKHELMHAIIFEYGLSNDSDSFTEEQVCNFMSIYGAEIESLVNQYFTERKAD